MTQTGSGPTDADVQRMREVYFHADWLTISDYGIRIILEQFTPAELAALRRELALAVPDRQSIHSIFRSLGLGEQK